LKPDQLHVLTHIPITFALAQVCEHCRVDPESEDAQELACLLERVNAVVNPKVLCGIAFIEDRTENTVTIDGITFTSRVLQVNLAPVHRVFPYVTTCGREFDEIEEELGGDPIKEYWLDQLRILALGTAREKLRAFILETYQPGKLSSMSPGSLEDWPITQQRELFDLLGDVYGSIGVELTESYLMRPLKSVSGMLFPAEKDFASCQLCPRPDCPGRSAPYDEKLWGEHYAGEKG
jgi:hypothetical protein